MEDGYLDLDDLTPKRGRGRPPGVGNRSSEERETSERYTQMLNRLMPILPKDQRLYFENRINGVVGVDVEIELEVVIAQAAAVVSTLADKHWRQGDSSREYADTMNALRMSIKDLNDIRKQKRTEESKQASEDQIDLTDRQRETDRVEALLKKAREKMNGTEG